MAARFAVAELGCVQGPGDMRYYFAWDEPLPEDEADARAGAAFKVTSMQDRECGGKGRGSEHSQLYTVLPPFLPSFLRASSTPSSPPPFLLLVRFQFTSWR